MKRSAEGIRVILGSPAIPAEGAGDAERRSWAALAERVLRSEKQAPAEVSIAFVDDEAIHVLNRDHRGKDRPTDVLSFDLGEGPAGRIGDVYVSLDTAARQAEARGHSLDHEVRFLLVHGLLHLSGYGHETDDEEDEMNRVTREHLEAFREEAEREGEGDA